MAAAEGETASSAPREQEEEMTPTIEDISCSQKRDTRRTTPVCYNALMSSSRRHPTTGTTMLTFQMIKKQKIKYFLLNVNEDIVLMWSSSSSRLSDVQVSIL